MNTCWVARREGIFKINFGEAVDVGGSVAGVGVVVRNSKGEVFAGFSKRVGGVVSLEVAKLKAGYKALRFANFFFWTD